MSKLVLVDGNSIASRAFYALPLLNNRQGVYTNAVYGFTQILFKILDEVAPDYMLVAFDAGRVTFRHTDYKEYKGKRLKTPPELSGQFPMLKELLKAFNLPYFELEEYEADDIIGTMVKLAEENNIETVIYTGDKDMLQLASEKTTIHLTRKGITEVDSFSPKQINEKYQLQPKQIIDLKGLMGDPSDNIPGVPGVGEKTALKLLHQYDSVEEIYEHVEEISGEKLKEKLLNHKDEAFLSKQLATIYNEVPMTMAIEDLKRKEWDEEKVYELFSKWEFNSLLDRFQLSPKNNQVKEQEEIKVDPLNDNTKKEWNTLFKQNGQILALHVETKGESVHTYEILGLSLSNGQKQIFVPSDFIMDWPDLLLWLEDEEKSKYVYDAKQIEMVLYWNQIVIKGISFDVLLASYLLNPSDGMITLAEIAKQNDYSGLLEDEMVYGKGAKYSVPDGEELKNHISRKANAIWNLTPLVIQEVEENNLYELLNNIELPLATILAEMEKKGINIDVERLKQMGIEFEIQLNQLTEEIYDLAGTDFNINSPKQLGEILFDKLQLPVIKKTKTGYSTSADVLEKLEPHHKIISLILHYRQLGKLKSTYIEGLLKVIHPKTKKIHTSFNQTITATGRLSSTEPNLQNIPIRLEEGRKIREAFIPTEDGWKILSADYSQIELRVLAHIANDDNLKKAFNEGMDIHTRTAMDVFGVKENEVTSIMRRQAKAVNFGIVYGISDYGLSQNLNISRKEAGEFINKYFAVFSGVKEYMKSIVDQAKKDGFVTTLLNRKRYLPDIYSSNFNIRSFAERTAMNTPIQGTAADIIKVAMIKIDKTLKENGLQSRMLLQVHDELIFEVHPDEVEVMTTFVRETMENAIKLIVPLKVDINTGLNWYEAK